MTIDTSAYGTLTGVGARTPRYVNEAGTFDNSTRPTGSQTEIFINEVSALLNTILAANGFATPVTQTSVVKMLTLFVEQEVAMMCEGVNGSGRFGPNVKTGNAGNYTLILNDINKFIQSIAVGMERMGATRSYSAVSGIGYRSTDEDGNAVNPLFQREAFDFEQDTDG